MQKKKTLYEWCMINDKNLINEWDYEKNTISPKDVSHGSKEKVFWKCKHGHSYTAIINNKTSIGSKCPICSNHQVSKGYNDLQTINPKLAEEWHPTKNGHLKPNQVAPNSQISVWWYSEKCGHEWTAKIASRNSGNTSCPYCSNKKVLIGYNDLATTHPDIAKEWHPTKNGDLKPTDVTFGSNKKVWWLCSEGHSYQTKIVYRAFNKTICPYCAHRKLLTGYNDLQTLYPELAKEWHPTRNGELLPTQTIGGDNKKIWWMCKKGHEWIASISQRKCGSGCPICSSEHRTSFPEFAIFYFIKQYAPDTIHTYKDLGFEIDIYIPSIKTGIEYDGAHYHKNRVQNDKCKNQKCKELGIVLYRIREEPLNSLNDYSIDINSDRSQKNLSLVIELLIEKLFGIKTKIDVLNHLIAINNLREFSLKTSSLAVVFPKFTKEWHPTKNGNLKPTDVTAGSGKKVWWVCEHGHEWEATINSRTRGSNCPICSNKKVLAGYNDLLTINPKLAEEWHPFKNKNLTSKDITCGSEKKIWWICPKCGHEWQATVKDRHNKGSGCPSCAGYRRVRNVETGEVFDGKAEAAKKYNIKYSHCITLACESSNKTAGGYHWEYIT